MTTDVYSADFETVNDVNDCRVWAWGIARIDDLDTYTSGNKLKDFMNYLRNAAPCTVYFHNARFDTEFIFSYLLKMGWRWVEKNPKPNEFTLLMSDKRVFYTTTLCFANRKGKPVQVKILDSFKLFPRSVDYLAKAFKLPELKLQIDYNAERPYGHVLSEEEEEYIKHDVIIMARILKLFLDQGFKKITIGSNALNFYKEQTGNSFKAMFPVPLNDKFVRKTYKGGWVYLREGFSDIDVGEGMVLDVNSLFPSRMKYEIMPYGKAHYFKGNPPKECDLYIAHVLVDFVIKDNYLPTIQIKGSSRFQDAEYVTDSGGEIHLWLTCVDIKLMLDHYVMARFTVVEGYAYNGKIGMFDSYVDYWMEQKIKAEIEGNPAWREFSKFFLNNLYGKFGTNPKHGALFPVLENGVVKYKALTPEIGDSVYPAVASFTTAWARNKTIRSGQKVYSRFVYSDTDSLHLLGTEIPNELEIDKYALGAWKIESYFVRARFLRAKTYLEDLGDGKLNIKAAGIPDKVKETLNWDNFHFGFKTEKKLRRKTVAGGAVLIESKYEIKRR